MDPKAEARRHLNEAATRLVALSRRIHSHPELGFEERKASAWIAEVLADARFTVEAGVGGLETAFTARTGAGPLHIGICAEYDSLPGIGHACGHNLIAAMAAGAAIALRPLADDAGLTITVVGTPAEESGGGKIRLLHNGVFAPMHAAMMVHPAPMDLAEPPMLAWTQFDVHYAGKAAHASAFPQLGINAADALTVAQTAIGLLRQHMRPDDRVHGIITHGGDAPNVVPARASARYMVRAGNVGQLEEIRSKVVRCFEAGALASGARLEISPTCDDYAEVRHDRELAAIYRRNAEALGRVFPDLGPALQRTAGSTDMGNVSQALPSIHPTIGIESLPAVNHQPEFTAACITPAAERALLDGAMAMAWTAIDLASDPPLRRRLLGEPSP